MGFVITSLSAIVAIDPNSGDEGVWGFNDGVSWIPMVCADEERLKIILPMAENMAKQYGLEYKVVQFSIREDVTKAAKEKFL